MESIAKRYCNVTSFPPFASNDVLLDVLPSVAATHKRVKNFFEIRFSLRRSSEQRLALPEQCQHRVSDELLHRSTPPLQLVPQPLAGQAVMPEA